MKKGSRGFQKAVTGRKRSRLDEVTQQTSQKEKPSGHEREDENIK
jgi:hypothetical protein